MAEETILKAEKREAAGSAEARRLRRAGYIPAEVYSEEKENASIKVNAHDFTLMLKRHGEHQIMALEVDGKSEGHVLTKAVQHDPIKGDIIHADFVTVSMNKPIQVSLPIELVGESVGVKAGGILEQQLSDLEIECLPRDMVDNIPVDVTNLEVGAHLCVSDLTVPDGFTILADADIVVASVALPGAEPEEDAGADAEGETKEAETSTEGDG
jgi:large subunit ribosomal protein L25